MVVAPAQSSSSGISERVVFRLLDTGDIRIQVNAGQEFVSSELRARTRGVAQDGVSFVEDGEAIRISSSRRSVAFEASTQQGAVNGVIPPDSAVKILLSNGALEIFAPQTNQEQIT